MKMRDAIPQRTGFHLTVLLAICLYCAAAIHAQQEAPQPKAAAIEPAADELLHKMSAKLSSAQQFTVTGKRTMDPALAKGRPINLSVTCELSLQRPNQLMARMEGDKSKRAFFYDGAHVTLIDRTKNIYATVESPKTIDKMLDALHYNYGFTPPLADFLGQDPYADLTRNVQSGRVQGREAVGGAECHHLAFTQELVDWELWLATQDLLPRKFVLIEKHMPGQPRLEAVIAKWDLAPQLDAETFAFKPPMGAEKIEWIPFSAGDDAAASPGNKQEKGK